jgi:hypothetical protein
LFPDERAALFADTPWHVPCVDTGQARLARSIDTAQLPERLEGKQTIGDTQQLAGCPDVQTRLSRLTRALQRTAL